MQLFESMKPGDIYSPERAYKLLRFELHALPFHFKMVPNGIELGCRFSDMEVAAALMSQTAFWGNTDRERLAGIVDRGFKPAELGLVNRVISPTGTVFVKYLLLGHPETLSDQRDYYSHGSLFVLSKGERLARLNVLVNEYLIAKKRAQQLRVGTYGTGYAKASG